jgi:hypothetical protein
MGGFVHVRGVSIVRFPRLHVLKFKLETNFKTGVLSMWGRAYCGELKSVPDLRMMHVEDLPKRKIEISSQTEVRKAS